MARRLTSASQINSPLYTEATDETGLKYELPFSTVHPQVKVHARYADTFYLNTTYAQAAINSTTSGAGYLRNYPPYANNPKFTKRYAPGVTDDTNPIHGALGGGYAWDIDSPGIISVDMLLNVRASTNSDADINILAAVHVNGLDYDFFNSYRPTDTRVSGTKNPSVSLKILIDEDWQMPYIGVFPLAIKAVGAGDFAYAGWDLFITWTPLSGQFSLL